MGTPKKPGSNKKTTTTPKQPSSSNKEKKNRVVVARPPKSPAPPSSTHRDSDSESVLSQASSASSQRSGLPIFIQKQLAQDIEEAGGIKVFKENSSQLLSVLCNENEDVYGKRGDPIRSKITKKVLGWKQLDQGSYVEKVLNRLQVKSAETLQFELHKQNTKKFNKKISLQQLSDEDSSDSDEEDSEASASDKDSMASSVSIPRSILFSNQEERADPIESATMQASPPPSQSIAAPRGSGKYCLFFVINPNSTLY
jgi:hypothetical protein